MGKSRRRLNRFSTRNRPPIAHARAFVSQNSRAHNVEYVRPAPNGHVLAVSFLTQPTQSQLVTAVPIVGMRALKGECMHQYGFRRVVLAAAVVGLCAIPTAVANAQPPPDNSKVNTRDKSKGAQTADQQKENAADRELTRSIRRSLMDDKDLSSYAHNVKIISQGGKVTLKGPVRSEDEKRVVEAKATEVAGEGHVTNQMSVAKKKS